MSKPQPTQTIRGPRFNAEQRRTLDAIGIAFKTQLIDFRTAAELSDMVKTGRVGDVLNWLESGQFDRKPN